MSDYHPLVLSTQSQASRLELVPSFGGLCNSLQLTTANGALLNIVAGLRSRAELENNKYFRGVALYPYVNRLDAGRYRFNQRDYQFPINEPAFDNSLHGFLMSITPEIHDLVENEDSAAVTLIYRYDGSNPGYPFSAEIHLNYHLNDSDGLTLTFTVKNLHRDIVPVGIGWHPYFTLGEKVDDLKLKLPRVKRVEVNERLLPTGNVHHFDDFEKLSRIGERNLDDCMQLSESSADIVNTVLWSDAKQLGLEVWQDCKTSKQQTPEIHGKFPYVQVFIPPDRQSIAIEPVSCSINAFNTGEDLVYLEPNAVLSCQCGVRLLHSLP